MYVCVCVCVCMYHNAWTIWKLYWVKTDAYTIDYCRFNHCGNHTVYMDELKVSTWVTALKVCTQEDIYTCFNIICDWLCEHWYSIIQCMKQCPLSKCSLCCHLDANKMVMVHMTTITTVTYSYLIDVIIIMYLARS